MPLYSWPLVDVTVGSVGAWDRRFARKMRQQVLPGKIIGVAMPITIFAAAGRVDGEGDDNMVLRLYD